jgi:hypothetical protein
MNENNIDIEKIRNGHIEKEKEPERPERPERSANISVKSSMKPIEKGH